MTLTKADRQYADRVAKERRLRYSVVKNMVGLSSKFMESMTPESIRRTYFELMG